MTRRRNHLLDWLSLFGAGSTLICCALPALMVALGAGATLAGLVTTVPQLIWLSEHKIAVFSLSALILALAGVARWRSRHAPCPLDPAQARICSRLRRLGVWIYAAALLLYMIGFFFAFIAPYWRA